MTSQLPTLSRVTLTSLALFGSVALLSSELSATPGEGGGEGSGGARAEPQASPEPSTGGSPAKGAEPSPPKPELPLSYPHPTKEEVNHEPPLLEDALALSPLKLDQERCRAKKGQWSTHNERLHGCVIKRKREGRWHLSAEDGSISLLAHFKNDKLDGLYQEFSAQGRARAQGVWRAGKKEGRWLSWHSGGQLESVTHFQEGQEHGRHFSWFETCLPRAWGAYERGERQGPWRAWYMTGARQEEGRYEQGQPEGVWRYYHSEGNKLEEGTLRRGLKVGSWQEWFHTGQAWRSVEYQEGQREGEDPAACRAEGGDWEVDYKERVERCVLNDLMIIAELRYGPGGALKRRLPYVEGQHTGLDRRFHKSGALLAEGRYVRGVPEGSHRYLTPSGEEFAKVTIEGGSGLWVSYHPNGAIEEVGRYQGGMKVGVWRLFHDHVQGQSEPISDPQLALTATNPAGLKEELIFSEKGVLDGPYLSLYEDGTLSIKGDYKGGSRSGAWQFNYQNGQPAVQGDFQFGVRMGAWKEWHWMASPKIEGQFQFNRKDGLWREYHNNGKLKAEGQYKRGQKEGPWKLYWYSGEPWRSLTYTAGVAEDKEADQCERISGKWSEDLKGRSAGCKVCRVTAEGTPTSLKLGLWRWWHPNGKLQVEGHFESGERHGRWRQFNEQERRILEGQYAHGRQVKQWRGYYPDGRLKFQGQYSAQRPVSAKGEVVTEGAHEQEDALKGGHEDGVWYTFTPNGSLESVGRYLDGARVGLWAWWGLDGSLSQIGAYQSGEREGVWVSWYPGGELRDVGAYQAGARRGVWRWWRAGGEPWRAQWYGPDKRRASLPPPDPLKAPQPLDDVRVKLTERFKGVSESAVDRAPETVALDAPLTLPEPSAQIRDALKALGVSALPAQEGSSDAPPPSVP